MGRGIFSQCRVLNKVTFEEGVTEVPAEAFDRCRTLETVVIPESVTTIGEGAFWDCVKLTTLDIPKMFRPLPYRPEGLWESST